MKKCIHCYHSNPLQAKFCTNCGASLEGRCPNCEAKIQDGAKFCMECGVRLNSSLSLLPDSQQGPVLLKGVSPPLLTTERRQLSVMFCDLVGSTSLSERLDPEELRDLVREYQLVCSKVVQGYEGYIHQFLGDGVLVIFSYPKAHEDDAHRAVRSGLAILDGLHNLNIRLKKENRPPLSARIGIHTGLLVIGEMSGELQLMGETTNLAARLKGIAQIDTLVISEVTHRLVKGYFECRPLGEHQVKGISRNIQIFQVLHESGARSRMEISSPELLTPLIGRDQELALMIQHWEKAVAGSGHVILLEGEAGIGKSRLIYAIKKHIAQNPESWLTECLCSPHHQNSAFFPIINLLEKVVLQFEEEDSQKGKLAKIEGFLIQFGCSLTEYVPLLASLLSIPFEEYYPPSLLTPEQRKEKISHILLSILLRRSEKQPVLLVVEDLHWIDPTTLEFISLIINHVPTARILTLLTFRPQFIPPWSNKSHITALTIKRLKSSHTKRMIDDITGDKILPAEVITQLVSRTDGVPLFVEELTKMVLESGFFKERGDSFYLKGSLPFLAIPATLKDSLMARLDRLSTVRKLAQLGAVIGREFSYSLLKNISNLSEEYLKRDLHKLVLVEILYQRGEPPHATYLFKHALIRDTAYQSLLKSKRQQYHQRVAIAIEKNFTNITTSQPELLAHHYTEAGQNKKAIKYWLLAGKLAAERFANQEAINHLKKGLKLIGYINYPVDRKKRELDILMVLGPVVMSEKGYSSKETAQIYTRAKILCQELGEAPQLFYVICGQFWFHLLNAEFEKCQKIVNRMLLLVEETQSTDQVIEANNAAGSLNFFLGNPVLALKHFDQLIEHYDQEHHGSMASRYGHDLGVMGICQSARALWTAGYPDQALKRVG